MTPGNLVDMAIAFSKVTVQGQISVPSEVRKKLGVGPGSVLEWDEQDDQVVIRRAARFTSRDIHDVLFPEQTSEKASEDGKEAIRKYLRKRHSRR
jgi:AbrB family looped-hinge helix DNA binding protein